MEDEATTVETEVKEPNENRHKRSERKERHRDSDQRRKDERKNDDRRDRTDYSKRRRYDERSRSDRERDRDRNRDKDRHRPRENDGKHKNEEVKTDQPVKKKKPISEEEENLLTRTGGAYIPPAKLRMLQAQITDKSSNAYQRIAWEALKKSLNGLINKVNVSNVGIIIRELFRENVVRGRGLLSRSILQAQAASPTFTHVYACFVSIINSKFPQIGELILKRLIVQFRQGFRRNDKAICMSSTRFIAHLVNQEVAHELLALEILTLLLESPTDDAVEVAIGFLKECGMKLTEITPRGIHATFERLRSILHEGNLDKRVQYMIEVMFAIRKDKFVDHVSVPEDLDLVNESDRYTHLIKLDDEVDPETMLNVFKYDPNYEETEEKYKAIRKEILEESSDEGSDGDNEDGDSEEEESEEEEGDESSKVIVDKTETNLVALRRTIYLTIQSSLDFEECAHKLLKMELKPGQEVELCHMILDCCAQQRTYEKFFGLLGQRFCQLNKMYITPFEQIFVDSYDTIHRLETNKLRNVAKLFSHLLYTDAISWMVLAHIRLNEQDTTSSSRIFIKILFQELSEYMGLPKLNDRLKDVTLKEAFEGLFPRDNPRNTRFAINFFTSIGLGGLTDELREHLKSQPKLTSIPNPGVGGEDEDVVNLASESSSSDSSSSSEHDDSSSDSSKEESAESSASESSDSEPDVPVSRKKKKNKSNKSRRKSETSRAKKDKKNKSDRKEKGSRREKKSKIYEEESPVAEKIKKRKRHSEREKTSEVVEVKRRRRDENQQSGRDERGRERHRHR